MPISEHGRTRNEKWFQSRHELKEDSVGPRQWFFTVQKGLPLFVFLRGFFVKRQLGLSDSVHVTDGGFRSSPGFRKLVWFFPVSASALGSVCVLVSAKLPFCSSSRALKQAVAANVLVSQPGSRSRAVWSTQEKTAASWVLWPLNLSLQIPEFLVLPPHCLLGFFSTLHIIKPRNELTISLRALWSLLIPNFAIHPVGKMNPFSLPSKSPLLSNFCWLCSTHRILTKARQQLPSPIQTLTISVPSVNKQLLSSSNVPNMRDFAENKTGTAMLQGAFRQWGLSFSAGKDVSLLVDF